jgi:DNA (cytosine-5)-methyltransferase 1
VAQRRKRVFVVASARDDFDPAAVLFEFDGMRRDTAPSREAGKEVAPDAGASSQFGGMSPVAGTLAASTGGMTRPAGNANELDFCIPIALQDTTTREKAQNGRGWNDDGTAYTVDTHATQGVAQPIPLDMRNAGRDPEKHDEMNRQGVGVGDPGDPAHTVTSAFVHAVAQPIAFAQNQRDEVRIMQVAGALAAEPGAKQQTYLAQPIIGGVDYENNAHGPDDVTGPLLKGSPTGGGRPLPAIALQSMAVRRLTPVECERLQGFPDNYTNIPWRKKEESPDGPRYKALGNSWAVPNVRWIGKRIQEELNALP